MCYNAYVVLKNDMGAEAILNLLMQTSINDTMKVSLSLYGTMSPFLICHRRYRVMKKKKDLLRMILAALFLALSYVMPFLTGQIPEVGAMLCPLHIPVLLCGFVCGPIWGMLVGITAPLLRSLTLGMPPVFPTALCLAFELAVYGMLTGLMHNIFPRKKPYIYCSLLIAMIAGRIVWGMAMLICMGVSGGGFTLGAFFAGAFTNAVPGIIVQLIIVPIIVMVLDRTMETE